MERNLTTGGVFKNIVYFSLPYLLSYFLQTLYGMADLFITGQFRGVADITAVAIGSQVMHMLTVMIVGLAMGSTVAIGRAVGGGDRARAACAIGNTVTLFMALSLALTVVLFALADEIVAVMSTPADAVGGTAAYLKICFAGVPFITAYNIISSIFRGLGDTKSPMHFVAAACAVNIALDYLFIGGFGMGPEGAALATTLSQAASVALALFVITRRRSGISVSRGDFRPKRAVMGQILKIGVPITLQDGFIQISFIIITIIVNMRGLADAAAVGIVEKMMSFLFLVPSSMLSAVSALGAPRRAEPRRGQAGARASHSALRGDNRRRLRRGRLRADAVRRGARRRALHRPREPGRRGGRAPRRAVHARLRLGLHLRGRALLLQRIFLRLRTLRPLVHAQCRLDNPRARPGRLPHVEILRRDALPDGPRHDRRLAALRSDMRRGLRGYHEAGGRNARVTKARLFSRGHKIRAARAFCAWQIFNLCYTIHRRECSFILIRKPEGEANP